MAEKHIEMCGAGRVEHYILEGVTDALFLAVRNLGTFELQAKTMQMWLHGV